MNTPDDILIVQLILRCAWRRPGLDDDGGVILDPTPLDPGGYLLIRHADTVDIYTRHASARALRLQTARSAL